jgi:hypothetical protein
MAGDAVADRGNGTAAGSRGDPVFERGNPIDILLRGVEFAAEDAGDAVVRDRDGVRVRAGRRKATLRNLSNGEGCTAVRTRKIKPSKCNAPWALTVD